MGILDFVPLKELPKQKEYDDSRGIVNCDICGKEFLGQAWMLKSKKEITCPACWYKQKNEESLNDEMQDIF